MVNCNPETVSTDYDTSEPAVLRAGDGRGRAGGLRRGAARGRDRAVRRPDAARLAPDARGRGLPGPGHVARGDRPGRGPRQVRAGPAPSSTSRPAAREARTLAGGPGRRGADRVPGGRPALLRPGRAGHGDRVRRRRPGDVRPHAPPRRRPTTRCWSTGSWRARSRSTSTRCADGREVFIGAVMEHIEEAGVHSGDSSCQIPPATLSDDELDEIEDITRPIGPAPRRARAC